MPKCTCEYHRNEYVYICKCKEIWPDTEKWEEHRDKKHSDIHDYLKAPSKLYEHTDVAGSLMRKLMVYGSKRR